ncbi:MAG: histidine kinase [Acidobacteria bacterium]|nr:histidine kinase [Acidobacteriota bacterium]
MEPPFTAARTPGWRWPQFVPRTALEILLGHLAVGLVQGAWVNVQFYIEKVAVPWERPFFWEITGLLGAFCAFPIVLTAVINAPRPADGWGRFLGIHLAAYLAYAALVPAFFLAFRHLLHPLFGWGAYDYGPLALKLPMEWLKLLIAYAAVAAGSMAWLNARESLLRSAREAELRERLQEARLQALSAQLDPHFLFNALNTVSSVMYEDLARTDTLLASLAQLLRDSLEAGGATWPLQRELKHLDAFLAFAEARFGERLRIHREIEAGLAPLPVPRFCLQRLVENAVKHNQEDPGRVLEVRIRLHAEPEHLVAEVRDDGGGFPDPAAALEGAGLGLRNLSEMLTLQYQGRGSLEAENLPEGGARVRLRIPLEQAHA